MTRNIRVRPVFFAIPLILLFFGLAVDSMGMDSPTMDEQNHMARGIAFLKSGDPRFSLEHPPLLNVINALPLLTIRELKVPFEHPSWEQSEGWYVFAEQLLWEANHDVTRMVFLARIPSLFITLALAIICYRFAKELWNRTAGLVCLTLILFDPNLIANGRYVTTDIGGTTFTLLGAYLLWRMWNSSGWRWSQLLMTSVCLGLALGSKMSTLVFIPIFGVIVLLPLFEDQRDLRDSLHRLLKFGVVILGGFFVVWAIFAFEWKSYHFQSESLGFLNNTRGPLATYFAGIEQILLISGGGRPSFLLGQFSTEGWWYYFPIAFLVKTPVIILFLMPVAIILLVKRKSTRSRSLFLLLPALFFFTVSVFSSLNIGYRHLLPVLPFLFLLVSGLLIDPILSDKLRYLNVTYSLAAIVFVIASYLIINITIHPHYLSYFNVVSGGPRNGYRLLVDSNIDWGQDLRRLESWMETKRVNEVSLSYFGTADPAYYQIEYKPLPGLPRHFDLWWNVPFDSQDPEPGVYAISVSNLQEIPLKDKIVFPWFREREPDEQIGYSINIYYVGIDTIPD